MGKETKLTKEDKAKNRILAKMGKGAKRTTNVSVFIDPTFRVSNTVIRPAEEIQYYCVIGKSWLEAWKRFGLAGKYEDIEFPYPPPGPINNFELLVPGSSNDIKQDLVLDQDYYVVSPGVWHVLHDIYGGGPVLQRSDIDLYSSHSGSKKVGMIMI
jgi:hypothetical protein